MKKVIIFILSMLMICMFAGCSGESGTPDQEPIVKTTKEILEEKGFLLQEAKLELPFDKDVLQVYCNQSGEQLYYQLVDAEFNVYNISNLKYSSTGKNYEVKNVEYEIAGIIGYHLVDSNCHYGTSGWYWDVTYDNVDVDSYVTSYNCYEDSASGIDYVTLKKDNKVYLQHYQMSTDDPEMFFWNLSLEGESILYDSKDERILNLFASYGITHGDFAVDNSIPYYLIVKTTDAVYIGVLKENPDFVEYADRETRLWDKYTGFEFVKSAELTAIKDELYFIGFRPWSSIIDIVLKDGSWYGGNIVALLDK